MAHNEMDNAPAASYAAQQDVINAMLDPLREAAPAAKHADWQLLEVKQLAEIAHRYRQKARYALNTLRLIDARRKSESDETERVYANYEAMFARDSLRAAMRLYRISNHDFHHAYAEYMRAVEGSGFSWLNLSPSNQNKEAGRTAA